jgi:hypothetical protein
MTNLKKRGLLESGRINGNRSVKLSFIIWPFNTTGSGRQGIQYLWIISGWLYLSTNSTKRKYPYIKDSFFLSTPECFLSFFLSLFLHSSRQQSLRSTSDLCFAWNKRRGFARVSPELRSDVQHPTGAGFGGTRPRLVVPADVVPFAFHCALCFIFSRQQEDYGTNFKESYFLWVWHLGTRAPTRACGDTEFTLIFLAHISQVVFCNRGNSAMKLK